MSLKRDRDIRVVLPLLGVADRAPAQAGANSALASKKHLVGQARYASNSSDVTNVSMIGEIGASGSSWLSAMIAARLSYDGLHAGRYRLKPGRRNGLQNEHDCTGIDQANTFNPCFCTTANSLSAMPLGRFAPASHF